MVGVGVLVPGETYPEAALVVVSGILLLALVIGLARGLPRLSPLLWPYAALILTSWISTLRNENGDDWRRALGILTGGAAAFVVGEREGHLARRGASILVGLAGGIVIAWGLYQAAYGWDELKRLVEEDTTLDAGERELYRLRIELRRPFATFPLPGLLGAFGAALAFVAGGAALDRSVSLWTRWPFGVLAVAAVVVVGLTNSTASIAAGALGLVLLALARAPAGRWRRASLAAVIVVATTLVAAAVAARRSDPRGSLSMRLSNWSASIAIARARPLLGVGPGSFADHYPRHVPPGGNRTRHAHSVLARSLAETGLVGLSACVWLLAVLGHRLLSALRRAEDGLQAGWSLAGIVLAAHAMVDIDLDVESLGLFTPFVWGVALSRPDAPPARPFQKLWWSAMLLFALVPFARQDLGRIAIARAGETARHEGRRAAVAELERASRLDPSSATAHLLLGRELLASRPDVAAEELEAARHVAPERGRVRQLLAVAYGRLGRREEACREARRAAMLLPGDAAAAETLRRLRCPPSANGTGAG